MQQAIMMLAVAEIQVRSITKKSLLKPFVRCFSLCRKTVSSIKRDSEPPPSKGNKALPGPFVDSFSNIIIDLI